MVTTSDRARVLASPMCAAAYGVAAALLFGIYSIFVLLISYDPSCSLQNFYVPALNKFINSTQPTSAYDSLIFFDLELQNAGNSKGVHYDAIDLSFYYATNRTTMDIGNYTVPGFCQGIGKKAQRRDVAIVTGKVPWEETAMTDLSNGSTARFRMNLATKVKFKYLFFYSSKRTIAVGRHVEVDETGKKLEKKPISLKSGAGTQPVGHLTFVAALLILLLL